MRVRLSRDSASVRVQEKSKSMAARILIADDSVSMRKALRRMLEEAGNWEIVEVEDGQQAVDKGVQIHPDLIILDLAMPVMNGFNAARELKKVLPEVPIIVHTLYWSAQTVTEALKAGAEKAIAKSQSQELIAEVKQKLAKGETDAGLRPQAGASLVGSPTLVPGPNRVIDIRAISEKAVQSAAEEPTETNDREKYRAS
jgi:DNA-binding NarL/FixJ family response regulator